MTPPIGDLLPEDLRRKHAYQMIRPAAILFRQCTSTTPPKPKFIIIVAEYGDNVGIVFINSEITPFKLKDNRFSALHLPICCSEYSFLLYDSHIDCSELYLIDKMQLIQEMTDNPDIHIGEIENNFFQEIRDTVGSSFKITPKMKKRFGLIK